MSKNRCVSLVITSCGRIDLLKKTLESFGNFNTYPISEVILVEDSGLEIEVSMISNLLKVSEDSIKVLVNKDNLGQIKSIDKAYSLVSAEFIFHCEDDWEFFSYGFIEQSLAILDSNESILCVWLRALDDTNKHPVGSKLHFCQGGEGYYYLDQNFLDRWSGFTFNPGLRRTKDMMRFHPFSNQKVLDKSIARNRTVTESDLSILYGRYGYRAAITSSKSGYVRHIGYGHHIAQSFEFKVRVFFRNLFYRFKKNDK